MLDGYIDFFMDPSLAECYLKLKEELNKLIQEKVISKSIYDTILYDVWLSNTCFFLLMLLFSYIHKTHIIFLVMINSFTN